MQDLCLIMALEMRSGSRPLSFAGSIEQEEINIFVTSYIISFVMASSTDKSPGATNMRLPIIGVVAAIAITTTMDASKLFVFSALPLFPLMVLFWYLQGFSRQRIGLVWSRVIYYGLAALYPVCVIGTLILISVAAHIIDTTHTVWWKAWANLAVTVSTTIVVAIITEEGFFRGWLWASLEKTGMRQNMIIIWTGIAFSLWHWSAVSLKTGFDLPAAQIPVFMVNAAVMGIGWGLLRSISGSIIVSSLSHGIWNGYAYVFFGYGTTTGALGITNTALFGPEVGVIGLVVNVLFVAALWLWQKKRDSLSSSLN